MINNRERTDDLCLDGLKIIQKTEGYGFTSDSVLIANFVKTKKKDKCVEIGAGSGIISILVNYKEKPEKIFAFEIQKEVASLAQRNIELNNMQAKIQIICDKIQNYKAYLEDGSIDVVFSNPPYFKYDERISGEIEEKVVSRFDKELPLCDFFESASKLLKFGGKLYFINCSSRLSECFCEMRKYNLSPKRMYFAHPNCSKNSSVFLCECIKGGKDGITIMPPLFTNNLDGDYIQTIQKLYKNG